MEEAKKKNSIKEALGSILNVDKAKEGASNWQSARKMSREAKGLDPSSVDIAFMEESSPQRTGGGSVRREGIKERRRMSADSKNALTEAEVAELGVQAIKSEFPDAAPEETAKAFLLSKGAIDGNPEPGVEADRRMLSQSPEGARVIGDAKAAQGGDRAETMGAMLSLVLPVLAGLAIGGKRGALHAAVGGGKSRLKTYEQREKAELDAEANTAAMKAAKEKIDYTYGKKLELEQAKNSPEARQAELEAISQEEAVRKATGAREEAYVEQGKDRAVYEQGQNLLARFAKEEVAGDGTILYQIKKRISSTEAGQLNAALKDFIFKRIKAVDGRPSDFDVKAMMKIIEGDMFSTNAEVAAKLLGQALESGKLVAEARVQHSSGRVDSLLGKTSSMSPEMRKAVEEAAVREQATADAKKRIPSLVAYAKKKGYDRDQLLSALASQTGAVLSSEDFDGYKGF